MDRIELDDCEVTCIIGILDRERVEAQRVGVEVRLGLDLDGAAAGDLSASVNYAAVLDQITFLLQEGKWWLLESVAAAFCRLVLAPPAAGEGRAQVERVEVRLRKPDVLAPAATPAIVVSRDRSFQAPTRPVAEGVWADVLQETEHNGAYRIRIDPGARWELPGSALFLAGGQGVVGKGPVENDGSEPLTLLLTGVILPG